MKTATLITGKVKFKAGKVFHNEYGERINIVVTPKDGGEDIKIWGNPNDAIAYLEKGQSVTFTYDGKSYTLVSTGIQDNNQTTNGNGKRTESTPGAVAMATPASVPARSLDVQEWVTIFQELRLALPQAEEQTLRAAANTIFMQRFKSLREEE